MKMQKCKNGHIYDGDKLRSCPKCTSIVFMSASKDVEGKKKIVTDTKIPRGEEQNGIRKVIKRKIVGMMVCMSGKMEGEGFFLREGVNDIGRSSNLDLALVEELSVSRQVNATIVCEGTKSLLQIKKKNVKVSVNGKPVEEEHLLNNRDLVQIGDCKLLYIETGIRWDEQ